MASQRGKKRNGRKGVTPPTANAKATRRFCRDEMRLPVRHHNGEESTKERATKRAITPNRKGIRVSEREREKERKRKKEKENISHRH
jgi:hypothetical protein